MEKQNSYSHILKYTSIFGGVQGLNILIGVVRNKLVALLLGPVGMGAVAIFASTSKLIVDATNLGLPMSAVREISDAYEHGDKTKVNRLIRIFRMWCAMTAVVGMFVCIAISPLLNKWTFSFGNHTLHYICLSPVVALTSISAGEMAILKATLHLRDIAKISIYSVVSSLLMSVPIYYFFGISGIIPVLVLVALAQMLFTLFFSFRHFPLRTSASESSFREGTLFVKLGLAFVVGCVFGSAAEFVIRSYLNYVAQVEVVGLYNAAYTMIVTYAGVVFTAMETDYYPRLSAIQSVGNELNEVVNRQIEVSLLLLSPLLVFFVVAMPVLLPMLFSGKFMPVLPMLQVASLSMYARVVFLPIEYISLSRADSLSYLLVEFFSYAILVAFVVLGFRYSGLWGTGVGMTLAGFIELVFVFLVYFLRYKFTFSVRVVKMFAFQIALGFSAYFITFLQNKILYWLLGVVLFILSFAYSLLVMRRETDVIDVLKQKILKKFKF